MNDIKIAVEKKAAHSVLSEANVEGSIMTIYYDDDTSFWRSLRRELVKEGLPSAAIHEHKHLIKEYVKELGARGVLDDGQKQTMTSMTAMGILICRKRIPHHALILRELNA